LTNFLFDISSPYDNDNDNGGDDDDVGGGGRSDGRRMKSLRNMWNVWCEWWKQRTKRKA